jgi:hypothetical protein
LRVPLSNHLPLKLLGDLVPKRIAAVAPALLPLRPDILVVLPLPLLLQVT